MYIYTHTHTHAHTHTCTHTHTHVHTHTHTHKHRRGVTKWRDRELPVQILDEWCKLKFIADPVWSPDHTKVVIEGVEYTLAQFGE